MANIMEIEGVGKTYATKLQSAGVVTVEDLLECGGPKQGRKQLAEKTGIDEGLILEWVNHADLSRIKGIGSEYSDLLEEAGVDTVVEMARRNPENLYRQLEVINEQKKLCRRLPGQAAVEDWIAQAKALPRMVSY